MQRPKHQTTTFARTPQDVLRAVLGVVEHGSYRLFALSNEHGRVLFSSDKTLMSFPREFIAEISPAEAGAAVSLVCGMVDGKPMGLIDGSKNKKFAATFLTELGEVLDGSRPGPTSHVESFWSNEDGLTVPWNGTDLPQVWPTRDA